MSRTAYDVAHCDFGGSFHAAYAQQFGRDKIAEHTSYIDEHGEERPEILGWRWHQ